MVRNWYYRQIESFFGQMILVAESREGITMKEVLAHPLGPIPWSLASPDGTPRKTDKAKFANFILKGISVAEQSDGGRPYVVVFDGMAFIRKTKGEGKTFIQLASNILSAVLSGGGGAADEIHVVNDTYKEMSIKNMERSKRATEVPTSYNNISGRDTWEALVTKQNC